MKFFSDLELEEVVRTIKLVIKENGENNGKGFNFFIEGDTERLDKGLKDDDLSPAEFWGGSLFVVCLDILKKVGVAK